MRDDLGDTLLPFGPGRGSCTSIEGDLRVHHLPTLLAKIVGGVGNCGLRCGLFRIDHLAIERVGATEHPHVAVIQLERGIDAFEELEIVGDDEDGAREAVDQLENPVARIGVEIVGGFVEQQHRWPVHYPRDDREQRRLAT